MELFISPGSSSVVSFDPDSILVLAYLYLGKCPIDVKDTMHDNASLSKLPLLRHGSVEKSGSVDVINYLRSQNYGLEYGLNDTDVVELASLVSAVNRQLTPAIDWFLWGEDNVFVKYTRKWCSASLSRLNALYLPHKWRQRKVYLAKHSQLVHCLRHMTDAEIGHELYGLAKRCLTAFSYILGKKTYFVGDRPTAIDAYVFSRLWPLLHYESQQGNVSWQSIGGTDGSGSVAQSASHPLIAHVLQCPNLVAHFIRIQNEFFPKAAAHFRRDETLLGKTNPIGDAFANHPVRDCLLFAGLAAGVFVAYAHSKGLIRILPD
ncbi:Metaxin-3 [Fasciola hepatica]|uniref:Metaxin-3 n=1 Tax=Fasciola hepatica TaxID=6192 RepID=A0A4E0RAT7_FASHE|nr:Metaxin-3 [Fasciola hepatica]